jgi:hypothetical protein
MYLDASSSVNSRHDRMLQEARRTGLSRLVAGAGVEPKRAESGGGGNVRFQLVLPDLALASEYLDSRANQAVLGWEERKVPQVSAEQCQLG